jgi:molybdate transport system substrate-binding protein
MRFLAALFTTLCLTVSLQAENITVSAAVSLKEALTDIGKTYESQTGDKINFNFAASGPLEAQIQQGAPVDAFISAANKQVDELVKAKLADTKSRQVIVRNEIVLIAAASAAAPPKDFADLTNPKINKIAIGQPKSVPAGQYASQSFSAMKLTDAVAAKLVYGSSVRQVLDYVQRNEVDAGIVYATDAKQAGDAVKTIAIAAENSHEPIEYPGVTITASPHVAAAEKFLKFLSTPPAQSVFTSAGFLLPAGTPTTQPAP